MTPEDIDELKREAEDWKTRWGAPMPAGQSQAMCTSVLKLVAFTKETADAQEELKKNLRLMAEQLEAERVSWRKEKSELLLSGGEYQRLWAIACKELEELKNK